MNRVFLVFSLSLAASYPQAGNTQEPPQPLTDAADAAPDFERELAPFISAYCTTCHAGSEPAGGLALETIDLQVSGRDFELWRMIRERMQYGEMPPPDAKQPTAVQRARVLTRIRQELRSTQQPGVSVHSKLKLPRYGNYVDHRALFHEHAGPVIPGPRRVWRLRPAAYNQVVVADTLGIGHTLSSPLSLVGGSELKDYSDRYFVDEATTDLLLANAEKIVRLRSRAVLETLTVSGETPPDKAVTAAVRQTFLSILHREPTTREAARFVKLYRRLLETSGPQLAAERLLIAIYMQPKALFREELGEGHPDEYGRIRLSQRELALALSYALGNGPDQPLIDAADAGELATREQILAQVERRLDSAVDQRANSRILQLFREYFNYPHAATVFKDVPPRGSYLRHVLVSDLELLIEHVVRNDEEVLYHLLTTNEYFVDCRRDPRSGRLIQSSSDPRNRPNHPDTTNPEYATVYSLPRDWIWTAQQPISMPRHMRAGVLTHPAWLVAWSGNFDNHPVQRGKWLRTHLLGGTVPDVPIGVDAVVPPGKDRPFRDRLSAATSSLQCQRCHRKMDPLGLPFEQFDHYGRFRTREAGQPVGTSGAITLVEDKALVGDVSTPIEMLHRLAKSEHVEQVFVRYVFRFFMGRNETLGDAKTLQEAHRAYRDNGGSFRQLVVSLLASDSFLYRSVE